MDEERAFFGDNSELMELPENRLCMESELETQRLQQQWAQYRQRPYFSFVLPPAEKTVPLAATEAFCVALYHYPATVCSIAAICPNARPLASSLDQNPRKRGLQTVSKLRLAAAWEALAKAQ